MLSSSPTEAGMWPLLQKESNFYFQYKVNHRILHWGLIMILKVQYNICIEHHALLSPKGSWRDARVWGKPRGWKSCVYQGINTLQYVLQVYLKTNTVSRFSPKGLLVGT